LDRQVLNLAFLVPGVVETSDSICGPGLGCTGMNFVSNGQRNSSADVRLDGALVSPPEGGVGSGENNITYSPTPEAVQEFNIVSNGLAAEYGSNGGTVVNYVTKSGTNHFHGSGYEFDRRPFGAANDFFSNLAGLPKPSSYERDQYGGTIGGPIIKNKTFFFFDYDRTRFHNASPSSTTVPTDLQKQGDFSQTFNADGWLMKIYNPFDVHPVTDSSGNVIDYQRNQFPGNVIPPLFMDPVSVKLMSLYPEPTRAGNPITGFNNFVKTEASSSPAWQYDIRIDHNFSDKSRLTGRFSHVWSGYNLSNNVYGTIADPDLATAANRDSNIALEETYTFSPTTVWSGRFGLDRLYLLSAPPTFDPTSVGWPSYLDAGGTLIFPNISIANYGSLGQTGGSGVLRNAHTFYHYASSLTKVKGGTASNSAASRESSSPTTISLWSRQVFSTSTTHRQPRTFSTPVA
jgi:hypothetical protein